MSLLNIKVENKKLDIYIEKNGSLTHEQEKALAVMLGAYNSLGRKCEVSEFHAIQAKFLILLNELAEKVS